MKMKIIMRPLQRAVASLVWATCKPASLSQQLKKAQQAEEGGLDKKAEHELFRHTTRFVARNHWDKCICISKAQYHGWFGYVEQVVVSVPKARQ